MIAAPQRRHLRRPMATARPACTALPATEGSSVVGHTGPWRGPVPRAAQHRLRPCRGKLGCRGRLGRTSASGYSRRTASFRSACGPAWARPNDITRGKDGNYYIAEQEGDGKPAPCLVTRSDGTVLVRNSTAAIDHGFGSTTLVGGDIYAGLTAERSVDISCRPSELSCLATSRSEIGRLQISRIGAGRSGKSITTTSSDSRCRAPHSSIAGRCR